MNISAHYSRKAYSEAVSRRQNKAVKTRITSNFRAILRALYPFLIALATLWAMPIGARAQLYASDGLAFNTVAEYNATTGALINPSLISNFYPGPLAQHPVRCERLP